MTPDLPTARAYCEAAFHSGAEGVLIQDKSMLRVVLDAVRAEANADAEHDLDALLIEARYWALCYQPGTEQKRRFTRVVDALQSLRAENAAHKARIAELVPLTPQMARAHVDLYTEMKARAEAAEADNARLRDGRDDLKSALHDLVMLQAQEEIGCVPPPTCEQWKVAWAQAEELVRIEP